MPTVSRTDYEAGLELARVALTRKLLTQIYWMLRNEEPYDTMVRRLEATGVSSYRNMGVRHRHLR